MSAILGAIQIDGQTVDQAAIGRMRTALTHRGGHGSTLWSDRTVALGHERSAVATDGVAQPLVRQLGRSRLILVADVRLDNRADLRERLGQQSQAEQSDEELLLEAYLKWGTECPERLEGDFAFALWDERDRSFLGVRDPIGMRSFYYHQSTSRFVFASEIKGVRAHGEISDEPDDEKVADYLGQVFADRSRTFHRDIRRLPPGHSIHVSENGVRLVRYWSLDPELRVEFADDREYAERFKSLFTEALECRMRTPRPLGILLSGGLDSSSMVCLARQNRETWGHSPLPVLSARFPDFPAIDEGSYIAEVVAPGHVEPSTISAGDTSPLREVEQMLAHTDEPFYSPNLFIYWSLARRARELGLDVLLDGVDGDTTVGHGLEWVAELLRSGRLRRAVAESRGLARSFGRRARSFMWHFGIQPAFVQPLRHRLAAIVGRGTPRPPATVSADLVRRVDWSPRLRSLLGPQLRPARTLRETHWRALTSDLLPHFLEVDDKASAAFGIESRHPYFDRRLIEFCYATPPDQKLSGGWDRVIQRRAMEGILPEKIRWRSSKSEWGAQFKSGFLTSDRDRIVEILAHPGALGQYVDLTRLAEAWGRCEGGRGPDDDIMNLWLATTLGLWLRNQTSLAI